MRILDFFKIKRSSDYKEYRYQNCRFNIHKDKYDELVEQIEAYITLAKLLGYAVEGYQVGERVYDIVVDRMSDSKMYRLRFRLKRNRSFGNMDCLVDYLNSAGWEYIKHENEVELFEKARALL